jgi:hypothetical protein
MKLIEKLANFIRIGFIALNTDTSHLGDRSTYVGASEMSFTQCPQQIIKNKRFPVAPDYKSALRFVKGHAMEDKLEDALQAAATQFLKASDVEFIREIEYTHPALALKAHIDFQTTPAELAKIVGKENITPEIEACHVVFMEVKSTTQAVSEDQIYSQLGIAHTAGIKAVNFCIVIDTASGDIEVKGPYFHNNSRYLDLENRGSYLLNCLAGRFQAKAIPGISCSFCQYRDECTAFPCLELPEEIALKVIHCDYLTKEMKALDTQKDILVDELKEFFKADTKVQVCGLLVNMKSYLPTSSFDGPALAEAIKSAKVELETVASKLTDSIGDDIFAFSGAVEIYNGLKKTIGELETSLETCLKSKAGYTKLEIRGDKKEPVKKEPKAKKEKATKAAKVLLLPTPDGDNTLSSGECAVS